MHVVAEVIDIVVLVFLLRNSHFHRCIEDVPHVRDLEAIQIDSMNDKVFCCMTTGHLGINLVIILTGEGLFGLLSRRRLRLLFFLLQNLRSVETLSLLRLLEGIAFSLILDLHLSFLG